ncbi:MAG TPA: hypothetical protein VFK06_08715, partial [Candidatus Angelobacter sp.]|nr:hypothetical protein [Candidatus Angelobacter sp.]
QRRHTIETAEMVVSPFMRDMSVAESVVIEAAINRDAGHAHRVHAKAAHVTDAEAADMRSTNDANVSTSEAADVTAAKTATAARKSGTASRGYSNHRGCGDCENFAVNLNFHNLAPFLWCRTKAGPRNADFPISIGVSTTLADFERRGIPKSVFL